MRIKLKFKRFQSDNNNEHNSKAKRITSYSNRITIATIITLIAFVMLIITLTISSSDAFNDKQQDYLQQEEQRMSFETFFRDNDIESVISATPNKNNSSIFTNTTLTLSITRLPTTTKQKARGHWNNKRSQSVSVKLKGDGDGDGDGHNGFYDKINTSNQRNEFNRISTPTMPTTPTTTTTIVQTKSVSEKFFEDIELQESLSSSSAQTSSYHRQLLPHRHKRYLVFPKGSSFQMIFDLIIGIVDYTSYAILGITCAVAWELPDKPPSELIEDVQLRLNEGTLGLRRNDSTTQTQLEYVDKAIAASEGSKAATTAVAAQRYGNDDDDDKVKMSATVADVGVAVKQRKPIAIATTTYYYDNAAVKQPSVTVNRHMPAYNAYHPYDNDNDNHNSNNNNYYNYRNYYYAGDNDINSSSSSSSSNDKSFQQQNSIAANGNAATHSNTHAAEFYSNNYNNNNKYNFGTYNSVKSTSGYSNHMGGGYDKRKYVDWNRKGAMRYDDSNKYNKYATKKDKHWWAQNKEHLKSTWQGRAQQWSTKYDASPKQPYLPVITYNAPIQQSYPGQARNGRARQILKQPPKHHIYPVFGKKRRRRHSSSSSNSSSSSDMTDFEQKMDKAHLKAHLQSRQLLYEKIEKLYKLRVGHNGTECVLRSICETAQRQMQQQNEPQSFISELLRVIFSMPQDMQQQQQQQHIAAREIAGHFRNAHAAAAAAAVDCKARYALCGHSIWSEF